MNKYFTSVSIYHSINSLYQKRLAYTKPDCVLIPRLYQQMIFAPCYKHRRVL